MSAQSRSSIKEQVDKITEKLRDEDLEVSIQQRIQELEESLQPKLAEIEGTQQEIARLRSTLDALNGRSRTTDNTTTAVTDRVVSTEQILTVIRAAANPVSRDHVATVLGVPGKSTVSKFLRLTKEGTLTRTGYGAGSRYHVTETATLEPDTATDTGQDDASSEADPSKRDTTRKTSTTKKSQAKKSTTAS